MKKLYIAFTIWLIPFILVAATSTDKLELKDAISQALASSNSYKSAQSQIVETQAELDEAWGALWPSLASDATYSRLGASSGSTKNINSQYSINIINSSITLNPGTIYNSVMSARDGRIIAENSLRVVKSEIEKSTIQLFYDLILARETVKIQTESNSSLRENLRTVTAAFNQGRTSRLDYLTAKLTLANSDTDLINARSDAEIALAALNIKLGNDASMSTVPDETFKDIPSNEIEIMTSDESSRNQFINSLVAESLKNRPELLIKKSALNQYDHNRGIQSATYLWPSFFANGKYTRSKYNLANDATASSTLSDEWNNSWSLAFGATYKWGAIAPWDQSNARVRQQDEKKKQAQYDLDEFIKQITLEIMKNYSSMRAAYNSIITQKENVLIAEENMKAAQLQFQNGIIDNTKFLDANIQLIKTKKNYIQALVSYSIAKSSLNNVVGHEYFTLY